MNVDSEKQVARLIYGKYSGLICIIIQQFGFHAENTHDSISCIAHRSQIQALGQERDRRVLEAVVTNFHQGGFGDEQT